MSMIGNRLTETLESHPRLTGALLATMALLTSAVSTVAAGSGGVNGP